jgi:hypothetical protein
MKQSINKLKIIIYTLIPIISVLSLVGWFGGFFQFFTQHLHYEWRIRWLGSIGIILILLSITFVCWLLNRKNSSKIENIIILTMIILLFTITMISLVLCMFTGDILLAW